MRRSSGRPASAPQCRVPIQRNTRKENEAIKEGKPPVENWSEAKKCQKDTDARWTKKRGKNYFGYKNHVEVDVKLRRQCVPFGGTRSRAESIEVPSSPATERMPGTVFDLMGEAREPDTIQDPIKDRTRVRGDGSTSRKRYSEYNRDKGRRSPNSWRDRRGEAGVTEPRIQHGQILHFDVTSHIKWRVSSRKSQKKLFSLSSSLDKTITKSYFMVTKNRIRRFLTVKNPNTLSKTN